MFRNERIHSVLLTLKTCEVFTKLSIIAGNRTLHQSNTNNSKIFKFKAPQLVLRSKPKFEQSEPIHIHITLRINFD